MNSQVCVDVSLLGKLGNDVSLYLSILSTSEDGFNSGNVSLLARISGWTRKRVRRGLERLESSGFLVRENDGRRLKVASGGGSPRPTLSDEGESPRPTLVKKGESPRPSLGLENGSEAICNVLPSEERKTRMHAPAREGDQKTVTPSSRLTDIERRQKVVEVCNRWMTVFPGHGIQPPASLPPVVDALLREHSLTNFETGFSALVNKFESGGYGNRSPRPENLKRCVEHSSKDTQKASASNLTQKRRGYGPVAGHVPDPSYPYDRGASSQPARISEEERAKAKAYLDKICGKAS